MKGWRWYLGVLKTVVVVVVQLDALEILPRVEIVRVVRSHPSGITTFKTTLRKWLRIVCTVTARLPAAAGATGGATAGHTAADVLGVVVCRIDSAPAAIAAVAQRGQNR